MGAIASDKSLFHFDILPFKLKGKKVSIQYLPYKVRGSCIQYYSGTTKKGEGDFY